MQLNRNQREDYVEGKYLFASAGKISDRKEASRYAKKQVEDSNGGDQKRRLHLGKLFEHVDAVGKGCIGRGMDHRYYWLYK